MSAPDFYVDVDHPYELPATDSRTPPQQPPEISPPQGHPPSAAVLAAGSLVPPPLVPSSSAWLRAGLGPADARAVPERGDRWLTRATTRELAAMQRAAASKRPRAADGFAAADADGAEAEAEADAPASRAPAMPELSRLVSALDAAGKPLLRYSNLLDFGRPHADGPAFAVPLVPPGPNGAARLPPPPPAVDEAKRFAAPDRWSAAAAALAAARLSPAIAAKPVPAGAWEPMRRRGRRLPRRDSSTLVHSRGAAAPGSLRAPPRGEHLLVERVPWEANIRWDAPAVALADSAAWRAPDLRSMTGALADAAARTRSAALVDSMHGQPLDEIYLVHDLGQREGLWPATLAASAVDGDDGEEEEEEEEIETGAISLAPLAAGATAVVEGAAAGAGAATADPAAAVAAADRFVVPVGEDCWADEVLWDWETEHGLPSKRPRLALSLLDQRMLRLNMDERRGLLGADGSCPDALDGVPEEGGDLCDDYDNFDDDFFGEEFDDSDRDSDGDEEVGSLDEAHRRWRARARDRRRKRGPAENDEATFASRLLRRFGLRRRRAEDDALVLDALNYSRDDLYREKAEMSYRSVVSDVLLHSPLAHDFYLYHGFLSPMELENFHKPPIHLSMDKTQWLRPVRPGETALAALNGRPPSTVEELSCVRDQVYLFEYFEQHPPMLNMIGMASRLISYYRQLSDTDEHKGDAVEGELRVLAPSDQASVFGNVPPGATVRVLDNNMYTAPVARHKAQSTDFLLIRVPGSTDRWYVREIDNEFLVGQEQPKMRVPATNGKGYSEYAKMRLEIYVRRQLQCSQPSVGIREAELGRVFPARKTHKQSLIKSLLLKFGQLVVRNGQQVRDTYTAGPIVMCDDDVRDARDPEEECLFESARAAMYRLKKLGIHCLATPEQLLEHFEMFPPCGRPVYLAQLAHEIVRLLTIAPWSTTNDFYEARYEHHSMMELDGYGDPSGRGDLLSYVRMKESEGRQRKAETVLRKKTVTGTTSDLRKLSMEELQEELRRFGVTNREIDEILTSAPPGTGRWRLTDKLRLVSTQAAKELRSDANAFRFAREQRSRTEKMYSEFEDEVTRRVQKHINAISLTEADVDYSSDGYDLVQPPPGSVSSSAAATTAAAAAAATAAAAASPDPGAKGSGARSDVPKKRRLPGASGVDSDDESERRDLEDFTREQRSKAAAAAAAPAVAAAPTPRKGTHAPPPILLRSYRDRFSPGEPTFRSIVSRADYVLILQERKKHTDQMTSRLGQDKKRKRQRIRLHGVEEETVEKRERHRRRGETTVFTKSLQGPEAENKRRCRRCNMIGHVSSNKRCPFYNRPPSRRTKYDSDEEDEDDYYNGDDDDGAAPAAAAFAEPAPAKTARSSKKRKAASFAQRVIAERDDDDLDYDIGELAPAAPVVSAAPLQPRVVRKPAPRPEFFVRAELDGSVLRVRRQAMGPRRLFVLPRVRVDSALASATAVQEPWYMAPQAPWPLQPVRRVGPLTPRVELAEKLEAVWRRLVQLPIVLPFMRPVALRDYLKVVKRPIDLGLIRERIVSLVYTTEEEFLADMDLLASNCHAYNRSQNELPIMADEIVRQCRELLVALSPAVAPAVAEVPPLAAATELVVTTEPTLEEGHFAAESPSAAATE
jgi:hypothetical protein